MPRKKLSPPDEIVMKSNASARCRWEVKSVLEPRLVALLASKVMPDDDNFHIYKIPVVELIGKDADGKAYQDLANSIKKLMSKVLTIYEDDGWVMYNLFSMCRYNRKEGILEIGFHPDLKKHYLHLKSHFIQYSLTEFMQLPSIYSQRMYEYLQSWSDKKEFTTALNYLHEMLNTPPSFRKNFKDFRRYVLDKAYKDIHEKTSFTYKWEPLKEGRAVTKIRFIFDKNTLTTKEQDEIDKKKIHRITENEKFLAQLRCRILNGENCQGGKNKKDVCEFCIKLRASNKLIENKN